MNYKPRPILPYAGKDNILKSYQYDEQVSRMKPEEIFPENGEREYSVIVKHDGSYDIFPTFHATYMKSLLGTHVVDNVLGGTYSAIYSLWENAIRMYIADNSASITLYGEPTQAQIKTIASIINNKGLNWYIEFDFEDYQEDDQGTGPNEFIEAINRVIYPNEVPKEKQEKLKALRYFREPDYEEELRQNQALNRQLMKAAQVLDENEKYEEADKILNWLIQRPGTSNVPEGRVRRFHYTDGDNLESIRQHGIKLDKSKSWKQGDPRAVWSSDKIISSKPTIEFHVDPKKLISDTYQFGDVPVEDIIAIHEPWHEKYFYIKEELDNGSWTMQDLHDRMKDIPDTERYKDYWTAYRQILKEIDH